MRFPLKLAANLSWHIADDRIRGVKKSPLVMMLEPLQVGFELWAVLDGSLRVL